MADQARKEGGSSRGSEGLREPPPLGAGGSFEGLRGLYERALPLLSELRCLVRALCLPWIEGNKIGTWGGWEVVLAGGGLKRGGKGPARCVAWEWRYSIPMAFRWGFAPLAPRR